MSVWNSSSPNQLKMLEMGKEAPHFRERNRAARMLEKGFTHLRYEKSIVNKLHTEGKGSDISFISLSTAGLLNSWLSAKVWEARLPAS